MKKIIILTLTCILLLFNCNKNTSNIKSQTKMYEGGNFIINKNSSYMSHYSKYIENKLDNFFSFKCITNGFYYNSNVFNIKEYHADFSFKDVYNLSDVDISINKNIISNDVSGDGTSKSVGIFHVEDGYNKNNSNSYIKNIFQNEVIDIQMDYKDIKTSEAKCVYKYSSRINIVKPLYFAYPYINTEDTSSYVNSICKNRKFLIKWNKDELNKYGVVVILEWSGETPKYRNSIKGGTIRVIKFIEDDGEELLENDLFTYFPNGANLDISLVRGNFDIGLLSNGQSYKTEVLAIAKSRIYLE